MKKKVTKRVNKVKIPVWFPKKGDTIGVVTAGLPGKGEQETRCVVLEVAVVGNAIRMKLDNNSAVDYFPRNNPNRHWGQLVINDLFPADRAIACDDAGLTVMLGSVKRIIKYWQMSKTVWPRPSRMKK